MYIYSVQATCNEVIYFVQQFNWKKREMEMQHYLSKESIMLSKQFSNKEICDDTSRAKQYISGLTHDIWSYQIHILNYPEISWTTETAQYMSSLRYLNYEEDDFMMQIMENMNKRETDFFLNLNKRRKGKFGVSEHKNLPD